MGNLERNFIKALFELLKFQTSKYMQFKASNKNHNSTINYG
jgi:hypothetical protein